MGNFTSSSWGLVQMKTNGEADSSQVSGNCSGKERERGRERQDEFSACIGETDVKTSRCPPLLLPG